MTTREALEKKRAAQAVAGQAAARSGETVAPKGRQPGKLKKLFSKTGMAIAAGAMLTVAVNVVADGSGSGSGDCSGNYCKTSSEEACCKAPALPKACCVTLKYPDGLIVEVATCIGKDEFCGYRPSSQPPPA